jgi:iron complex transport system ATP-binding protein
VSSARSISVPGASACTDAHVSPHVDAGISFHDVTAGYGRTEILSGITLDIDCGQLVGLIGPNGAGKSTLLRLLTGNSDLLGGSALVAGIPVGELSARDRARLIGVLPQTPPSTFAFTAEEFVALGRHPHLGALERQTPADEEIVARVMEQTDTSRLAGQRVDTLSGGDLQRLTLAQALAQEPSVLLLDEPVSQLDLNHRLQILDLVRELADGGMAVLGVFHDLDLAARYSDRLAMVHDGGIRIQGAPATVLTPALIREVFAVRAVVAPDAVTGSISVVPVVREAVTSVSSRGSVLVVGGSGAAAPLMRRLVLAGYTVRAAALNRGDVDQAVAETLGIEHAVLPPFGEVTSDAEERVGQLAAASDVLVVAEVPFGAANVGNLRAAVSSGRPLVFLNGFDGSRDYCGGVASALAELALNSGAVTATHDELMETLALVGR